MLFEKTVNSRYFNFIAHHISVNSLKKIQEHIHGNVLDIGCGVKPYENIILQNTISSKDYIGCDYPGSIHSLDKVDILANAIELPFRDQVFNTVLSFQVLEHLNEPDLFFKEIYRILNKNGKVILTTPFIWGEHEQPHDFYRFTRYGLRYLAEKNGFYVINIEPLSGFWITSSLRLNYSLNRFFGKKLIKYFFIPIFVITQIIAFWFDKLDKNYTTDTFGFTSLLEKQ